MIIIKKLNRYSLMLILVATSQLVYLNSLSNHFVYDDEFTIVSNYFIKSWSHLPLLFTKEYFEYSGELSYRPVVTLSYFVDYSLWQLNPLGFHLTNSVLHTLNTVLLFFLFIQFFNRRAASFLAALIFSCHPVISEAVNAISYREDLLGATFFISAFFLYLKVSMEERQFTPVYFASVLCYLLSLFAKEMMITLPLFIFLYDLIFTKKINRGSKIIHYYPGYIFVSAFYLVIRFFILHNPIESNVSYPGDSIFVNFLTMSNVLASYIKLFFFPFNLCADYVIPNSHSLLDTSFILSSLFLSSVIIIACRLFFYSRIAFFSVVWPFISLLPVLNIVPIENIMTERYLYLPILGFCMIGGIVLTHRNTFRFFDEPYNAHDGCNQTQHKDEEHVVRGQGHRSPAAAQRTLGFTKILVRNKTSLLWKAVAVILLILVLAIFSITTVRRNFIWLDQTILWTSTEKVSPNSFKVHNNLGNLYRDAGKLDEAIVELKHALELYDNSVDAHNNLGVAYRKKGMLNEAISEYQRALHLNPRYPYAHNNLGVLYAKSDLLDLAIMEFTNAISNKPDYFDAHNNLGATYIRKGFFEQAVHECLEAIKYNNSYKDAYYNLSAAYFNNKQLDKALEACKMVLSMDPNHHNALEIYNLICEQK